MRKLLLALVFVLCLPNVAHAVRIVGAGDIATNGSGDLKTSNLVLALAPDRVLTFGDNAYNDGTASQFANLYHPTWGRFKDITLPAPGNHDHHTAGASGYEGYFGKQSGQLNSYVVGDWLLVQLDSEVNIAVQNVDLNNTLSADNHLCELLYWHHPRFSSGDHGNDTGVSSWWTTAYNHGVDLILNGHDHNYERFAKLNSQGQTAGNGIREIVVGTGGVNTRSFGAVKPGSQKRLTGNANWGVVDLNLKALRYDGVFRRATGGVGTIADTFGAKCHL